MVPLLFKKIGWTVLKSSCNSNGPRVHSTIPEFLSVPSTVKNSPFRWSVKFPVRQLHVSYMYFLHMIYSKNWPSFESEKTFRARNASHAQYSRSTIQYLDESTATEVLVLQNCIGTRQPTNGVEKPKSFSSVWMNVLESSATMSQCCGSILNGFQ